ncbi:nucleoporin Nup186/Nup192/Nup205 [Mucidula mucida]|nr:nucleoporin Nup186/Nup192/Nup205 [Mucidula mucida]
MESFSSLRHDLLDLIHGRPLAQGEQALFEQLMLHKTTLWKIFDIPPRNANELKEVQSGKVSIHGKQVAINADFANQVNFISQQLNCSERIVSGLLLDVVAENPNLTAPRYVDMVLLEYHLRRRQLTDCLRLIFEAVNLDDPNANPTVSRMLHYAMTDLNAAPASPSQSSFSSVLLREIDFLSTTLEATENARRSAQTNTVAPSAQNGGKFGADILNARCESLKYERRQLAITLYLISLHGLLTPLDVKTIVEWLSSNPNHAMTYYMLTTIMAMLDIVDPASPSGVRRDAIAKHPPTVAFMKTKLISSEWSEPGLQATLLMKWTLLSTDIRRRNASLESVDGFMSNQLEAQIWGAVQAEARKSKLPALLQSLTIEKLDKRDIPQEDFKSIVLQSFATLVQACLILAPSELRKIKQRQEDLVLASARGSTRGGPARYATPLAAPTPSSPPRNDVAMLYSLLGILYSSLPNDSALPFWGSSPRHTLSHMEAAEVMAAKLPAFLQWAVWSVAPQDTTMITALYDMLTGLATGQQCSELTYNFMARGGIEVVPDSTMPPASSSGGILSWEIIFNRLDTWASSSASTRAPPTQSLGRGFVHSPQQTVQHPVLNPKDVIMAQAFLHLLAVVVTHSISVRAAITSHHQFRAIPTMVSLIPLGIPLELKGTLFETLSAFCQPGGGSVGVEICKAVWTLMERYEVINVRPPSQSGFGGNLMNVKGLEVELEIESTHGVYPATIPFLQLLCTLIHTVKRVSLRERITDPGTLSTIPENLGQPYRLPGIGPFVAFVVDNVFAKIPAREYARPSDRWQMNDLCLCFIERSLASFDVESILASAEAGPLKAESLVSLLAHPGYDIMKMLLAATPLHQSITSYIVEGVDAFERGFADEEPFFASTIVRALRIVQRALEIQDLFLDVLIPVLFDFEGASSVGVVHPRSYFTRFDQSLSFGPHYVPAIASYVAYPAHPELVLLSVKIMSALSMSVALSSMAVLIQRSENSKRIMAGYIHILQSESVEDVLSAETVAEQSTGAGAPDVDLSIDLSQATRLAVLDLLIQSTETNSSYQSFARWLLFGSTKRSQQIEDPHALGSQQTCVHLVIELLNIGVPRLKGKGKEQEVRGTPMFMAIPALAERCYHILHTLCLDSSTSELTMRYLRTREDFFARHLAAIPTQGPRAEVEPFIEIVYADGTRLPTTVATFSAFLRSRSWIFNLVALELQVLMNRNQHKGVDDLLAILFSTQPIYDADPEWQDAIFDTFREVGQSNMRIIEYLHSLAFDWSDHLTVKPVDVKYLAQLPLHSCTRKDSSGCEVIDRGALLSLLTFARRSLVAQSKVATPANMEQVALESQYILESCAVENHRREVVYAAATGFESWRKMLDMALLRCFHRLPHDLRENTLFDLLQILPTILHSSEVEDSTAVVLAEMTLSAITKLREDRQQQIVLSSLSGDAESNVLPAERLYTILKNILECIIDNSRLELVRGNLYASIANTSTSSLLPPLPPPLCRMALIPQGRQSSSSPIQANSLALMKGGLERLVTTIARDAIDGSEVWKTVAFNLLTSLCQLSVAEKQYLVLTYLVRHGILTNFIHGVGESDLNLQAILKPDPDDLNALYVYESKMSLFIRIAHSRAGAERLLDANIISVLGRCDYLDARPEGDQDFMDQDTFLPSAVQRYHQLFMPAVELVNAIVATLGSKHASATNQALDFLSKHSPTIVILLKNETEDLSLSLLEEIHLLISLSTNVLHVVPKTDLASTGSGFGAIHAAILALSTQYLRAGHWVENVRPITDAEIASSNALSSGFGSESKFQAAVRQKERLVRKAVVAYLGAANDFTEPEINVMLAPSTAVPRLDERSSHFIATLPTLGDAIQALNDVLGDLEAMLNQMAFIASELSAREHVTVENIQEVVHLEPAVLQELNINQKRTLVCQEYERLEEGLKKDVKIVIHTAEMVLLLLWRHAMYYCDGHHVKPAEGKSYAIRLLSMPEPDSFRQELGRSLQPVLQRLRTVRLGEDWRDNQAYMEIMDRRLRDTVGLHQNDEGDDMSMIS